jgi:TRAP-type C4-dicarboxylate transport system permease small subunit
MLNKKREKTDYLEISLQYLLILSIASMVFLVIAQVFMRYVMKSPLRWSEELARFSFVWMTFLGAGLLAKYSQHMTITFFADRLSPATQWVLCFVNHGMVLFLCLITLFKGGRILTVSWSVLTPALRFPMFFFYLAAPIGLAIVAIYSLRNMVILLKPDHRFKRPEAVEPIITS